MHFLFSFCEDEDPGTILGGMPMIFQHRTAVTSDSGGRIVKKKTGVKGEGDR